jgi:hypothetical protein
MLNPEIPDPSVSQVSWCTKQRAYTAYSKANVLYKVLFQGRIFVLDEGQCMLINPTCDRPILQSGKNVSLQ